MTFYLTTSQLSSKNDVRDPLVWLARDRSFRSQIHSPFLVDKADYGIGLSYRPASLCSLFWRAGCWTEPESPGYWLVCFEFQHRLPGQLEPDPGTGWKDFVFKSWMLIGQNRNLLDTDWCILNFSTDCLGSWNQTQESGLKDFVFWRAGCWLDRIRISWILIGVFWISGQLPGQLEPDLGTRTGGLCYEEFYADWIEPDRLDFDWYVWKFSTDWLGSWNPT